MKAERKRNGWKWIAGGAALTGVAYTAHVNARRKAMPGESCLDAYNEEEDTGGVPGNKRILITGAGSYVGTSVECWLNKANGEYGEEVYHVTTLDMECGDWREHDFSQYDVVFHVAGIAHVDVGGVAEEQKQLYYRINTELAVDTARKAKESGVRQFIFMSSMIVYGGCRDKIITKDTQPNPKNFYGDSKWQADRKIRELGSGAFKVVVLRPPMIYGRGCKGNYPELAKLAAKLPAFPAVQNKRCMLYIDNLCQFVKLVIDNGESGVFFPQNGEYSNTSEMVRLIAEARGHKIILVPGLGWLVRLVMKVPGKIGGMAQKAFGDSAYEMGMSRYKAKYYIVDLLESIRRSGNE